MLLINVTLVNLTFHFPNTLRPRCSWFSDLPKCSAPIWRLQNPACCHPSNTPSQSILRHFNPIFACKSETSSQKTNWRRQYLSKRMSNALLMFTAQTNSFTLEFNTLCFDKRFQNAAEWSSDSFEHTYMWSSHSVHSERSDDSQYSGSRSTRNTWGTWHTWNTRSIRNTKTAPSKILAQLHEKTKRWFPSPRKCTGWKLTHQSNRSSITCEATAQNAV